MAIARFSAELSLSAPLPAPPRVVHFREEQRLGRPAELHVTFTLPAEIDPVNFAPRIHQPLLLLNGRYDPSYPVELLQKPLLRLLGTPDKDKRHVLVDSGHSVARSLERIRETIDWLDRYLGPVEKP